MTNHGLIGTATVDLDGAYNMRCECGHVVRWHPGAEGVADAGEATEAFRDHIRAARAREFAEPALPPPSMQGGTTFRVRDTEGKDRIVVAPDAETAISMAEAKGVEERRELVRIHGNALPRARYVHAVVVRMRDGVEDLS